MTIISDEEILILGGFSGQNLRDALTFNHVTLQLTKTKHEPWYETFGYQMPTIFDDKSGLVFTGDWKRKRIYSIEPRKTEMKLLEDFS